MEKEFVDANILVYAHDRGAGKKHDRALAVMRRLWENGQGALSTQVLQEFCVSLRCRSARPVTASEIKELIEDYTSWEIVTNNPPSILQALEIQDRYEISFWDALILQAAENCGASVLYSEDLSAGQKYGSVKVVNPLTDD